VEYTPADVGSIEARVIWRYGIDGKTPDIEHDFPKMKLNVNTRGTGLHIGTVAASDLEKISEHSYIVRIQFVAPQPSGIVKWSGVRFSDFASMLGVQCTARYVRFVGADNYYTEEDIGTLMHPQVMLVWKLNDAPIPPEHGAPLRLVVPFEWAARSVKRLTDILFTATSFPHPEGLLNQS
jgi:DMSO/TMAO reductase YedYZ molybdopterin-dependent catalytic subunit